MQNEQQKQKQQNFKENDPRVFLDQAKFKSEDEGLVLYQSTEEKFFKGFTLTVSLLLAYNIYQYSQSEEIEDREHSFYLMCIFGGIFLFMQYRIHKSPRTIWLDFDGKTTYVDFFRYGGFSSTPKQIENTSYLGFGHYIHRKTNMPIFRYLEKGKKKWGFFKISEVQEHEVLKNCFKGRIFKVAASGMDKKLSKKTKDRYSL